MKYLGVPLGGVPSSLSFWDPMLERIQNKLECEKRIYPVER